MKRVQSFILSMVLLLSCLYIPVDVMAEEEQGESSAQEQTAEEGTEKTAEQEQAEAEDAEQTQPAVEISAPSAVLMEASTGTVIFEKDSDTARPPASVTKIMTMLLIFDALEEGSIGLDDEVTTSEYAASMGGSQVFLEPGEIQTVDTMLKCIAVASANDACVAMSEYICGSEEEFVRRMNERAKELGMKNTNFVNCNGLDAQGHVTSARDIALMSRELITKYPQVHDYSMIWMENITHTTKKGTTEFGLTNTNKLVRQYEYTTGLKTGSTGDAKFCVSATGEKNGIEMIAVVMAAENSKERFADAVKLLNYGFGRCQLYTDEEEEGIEDIEVESGVEDTVGVQRAAPFSYLDTAGADLNSIEKKIEMEKEVKAPLKKGDVVGYIVYKLDGKEIGRSELIAEKSVKNAGIMDFLRRALKELAL